MAPIFLVGSNSSGVLDEVAALLFFAGATGEALRHVEITFDSVTQEKSGGVQFVRKKSENSIRKGW